MKTTHYDEREVTEWLFRCGAPALAWALIFAFFAFSDLVSRDEPGRTADAAPAPRLMANETASAPAMLPSAHEPAVRDAAVVTHEALDPVGAGLNTTETGAVPSFRMSGASSSELVRTPSVHMSNTSHYTDHVPQNVR